MAHFLDWAEQIGIALATIGFGLALLARDPFIMYATCLFTGMIFGRRWWRHRQGLKTGLAIITIFFIFGFMIGSLFANLQLITLFFAGGIAAGYWLHHKKIIRSLEY